MRPSVEYFTWWASDCRSKFLDRLDAHLLHVLPSCSLQEQLDVDEDEEPKYHRQEKPEDGRRMRHPLRSHLSLRGTRCTNLDHHRWPALHNIRCRIHNRVDYTRLSLSPPSATVGGFGSLFDFQTTPSIDANLLYFLTSQSQPDPLQLDLIQVLHVQVPKLEIDP
ncbi:hypothetical protein HN51_041459 [Arachis hypogaea]